MNRESYPAVMDVPWAPTAVVHAPPSRALRGLPVEVTLQWMALYFGAHVVLSILAEHFWPLATVWALAASLIGFAAVTRGKNFDTVVVIAAYVVGAELLWRGTHARVFWEYGKYVLILIFGLALLRRLRGRLEWRALLFLACLTPSLAVLPYFDRQDVAFNLSGPVALAVAAMVLTNVTIDRHLLLRLSVIALGPIIGLAFLSGFGTLRADPRTFAIGGKATTAGIGPNQVSSILGLGVVFVFILLLFGPRGRIYRLGLGAVGIWLLGQTVLSFSRGGLWTAAGTVLIAAVFLVRDRRRRRTLLVLAAIGFVVFHFVVFPTADRISGGIVARRFTDTDLTGREKIMKADWIIFREHPFLGIGPGQSYAAHVITFRASEAHTEYTRLLAEHGSFGVVAVFMLAWLVWDRWRRREPKPEKGIGLACMAWTLLYMGHSAMRLAAPALMFGIGCATLVLGVVDQPGRWRRVMLPSAGHVDGER